MLNKALKRASITAILAFIVCTLVMPRTAARMTPAEAIHASHNQIYPKILKTTTIDLANFKKVAHIEHPIDGAQYEMFDKEMADTADLPGARIILIDSPGGDVYIGDMMVRLMKAEQARGVKEICVVEKGAHSMAFNFLTNCDVRLAIKGAFSVVHKVAAGGIDELGGRHTAQWFRHQADILEKLDEPYRQANARAMGLSLEDYDLYADEETPWSATTLVLMGYFQGFAVIK